MHDLTISPEICPTNVIGIYFHCKYCFMSSSERFIVIEQISLTSLISFLLRPRTSSNTLIICSARDQFLQDLLSECQTEEAAKQTSAEESFPREQHPLLVPTIHLLATSQNIKVVFAPTLPHLRAYLATHEAPDSPGNAKVSYVKPGSTTPFLAILNTLQLHQLSGELSAQGLSRTFASAVDAAARTNLQLIIADGPSQGDTDMDGMETETHGPPSDPWRQQVPLLNGSVRFGAEQRLWAGRTVEVRQVIGRWCRFIKTDQIHGEG